MQWPCVLTENLPLRGEACREINWGHSFYNGEPFVTTCREGHTFLRSVSYVLNKLILMHRWLPFEMPFTHEGTWLPSDVRLHGKAAETNRVSET